MDAVHLTGLHLWKRTNTKVREGTSTDTMTQGSHQLIEFIKRYEMVEYTNPARMLVK